MAVRQDWFCDDSKCFISIIKLYKMDRREFSKKLLGAVASYALFDSLFATNSFSRPVKEITNYWVNRLNEYCSDLKKNAISPV